MSYKLWFILIVLVMLFMKQKWKHSDQTPNDNSTYLTPIFRCPSLKNHRWNLNSVKFYLTRKVSSSWRVRSGTGTPIRVAAYSIHPPAKIPAASDNVFPFYCFSKWLYLNFSEKLTIPTRLSQQYAIFKQSWSILL